MVDSLREAVQDRSGPKGATNTATALDITQLNRSRTMPDPKHYYDSAQSRKPEQSDNPPAKWQSIGDLARALVKQAEDDS